MTKLLQATRDLSIPPARADAGRHEYEGAAPDLSDLRAALEQR
jgi:hypothetical protein